MSASSGGPLVSIGIPTYNRAATLGRSLESALAQTHSPLEVIVADDGSRDGTAELCRAIAARDARLRYLRSEENRGSTDAFNRLFVECRGEFVMMLADDDWIDAEYVARCLERLREDRGLALASGWPRYVRDGRHVGDGVAHVHRQSSPARRVRDYLSRVDDNGVMYGLMPRHVLDGARPLPNVLGNDWLWVARIAYQGRVHMLPEVRVHRELGGTSVTIESILATFQLPRWQARVPQLVIAWQVLRDVAWGHPIYRPLGRRGRWALGLRGALASVRWRALAWHLITPTMVRIGRRRRGRGALALYGRITRALGAGRRP